MLYVLGGFAILCGLLLLGWVFVNTSPVRLARALKWTGIVLIVAALSSSLGILMPLATSLISLGD